MTCLSQYSNEGPNGVVSMEENVCTVLIVFLPILGALTYISARPGDV